MNPAAEPFVPQATMQSAGEQLIVVSYGYRRLTMPKPATYDHLVRIVRHQFSIPYPTWIHIVFHFHGTTFTLEMNNNTFSSLRHMDTLRLQTDRDMCFFISNSTLRTESPTWRQTAYNTANVGRHRDRPFPLHVVRDYPHRTIQHDDQANQTDICDGIRHGFGRRSLFMVWAGAC